MGSIRHTTSKLRLSQVISSGRLRPVAIKCLFQAICRRAQSDHVIHSQSDGSYIIRDKVARRDGTDTVSNVEFLKFFDKTNSFAEVCPNRQHRTSDFNDDSKGDAFFQNVNDGSCQIWQMNGLALKTRGVGAGSDTVHSKGSCQCEPVAGALLRLAGLAWAQRR